MAVGVVGKHCGKVGSWTNENEREREMGNRSERTRQGAAPWRAPRRHSSAALVP